MDLIELLRSHRLRYGTERQLQDDVERLLTSAGVQFTREAHLTATSDRIDFLTDDGAGIECKIAGGPSAILSQLIRYADDPMVRSIVLVTSRRTHRLRATELRGKPLTIVWVAANAAL